jgi:hypothetical protein
VIPVLEMSRPVKHPFIPGETYGQRKYRLKKEKLKLLKETDPAAYEARIKAKKEYDQNYYDTKIAPTKSYNKVRGLARPIQDLDLPEPDEYLGKTIPTERGRIHRL